MPPQGESIGMAFEDVVLLSRIIGKHNKTKPASDIFTLYESLRRERIEAAYQEANWRFGTVKDKGWLVGVLMDWITPLFLRFSNAERVKALMHDVREDDIE